MNFLSRLVGPDSLLAGVRNVLAVRSNPLDFLSSLAQQGDIVYRRLGPYPAYLLNTPELVRELLVNHARTSTKGPLVQRSKQLFGQGLLTGEGEHHLRQRRLMQPLFQRQRLTRYAPCMVECAELCAARWKNGQVLELHAEMMRLTLAVVGKALFGDDFERDADRISEAVHKVLAAANVRAEALTLVLERLRLPVPARRHLLQARELLENVIRRRAAARRHSASGQEDLLSLLLCAHDPEGDGTAMDEAQLVDECVTLLLAGHETTASALTFALYMLSQNPQVEAKLHAELEQVLAGRAASADDLPGLAYTQQVFAETLRLYPPAWMMSRFLTAPTHLGGRNFASGTLLIASQYTMHRDARFFPEPLLFKPERFTPEAKAARPKYAYFPFGAGPRQCIGEGFAWMEGTLILATLAQQFTLRLAPGHRVEPEALLTLRPRYGMQMVVHRRPRAGGRKTARL